MPQDKISWGESWDRKQQLAAKLTRFGFFDSVKKVLSEATNDSGKGNPCHDPKSGRFCETEGESKVGTPLTQQNYIKATGRGGAKTASTGHLMTQKEFIELTGRGGAKKAASDHPMTQREFIESTGRGNAKKASNDHPMTMREFIEATGRGGAKNAPNSHPMTDEEFRKAMGFGKRR